MSPLSYFTERASEVCGQIRVYSRSNGGKISVRLPVKEQNWHKIPHGFSFNTLFCFVQVLPQNKRIPVTPSLLFINKCKSVFLSFSLLNLFEFLDQEWPVLEIVAVYISFIVSKNILWNPHQFLHCQDFRNTFNSASPDKEKRGTSEFGNNRLCYL